MELKNATYLMQKALQVLSWVIFIGLCIEAGGIAVNTIITLFINPAGAHNYWEAKEYLSGLYEFNQAHFFTLIMVMIIVAVLKAIMFFLIVQLFANRKLNIAQPFSQELKRFIELQAYLALGIGMFANGGSKFSGWLADQGFNKADLQSLHLGGADVWIFMAVVLFVIAQVVKSGIALQHENDLTI